MTNNSNISNLIAKEILRQISEEETNTLNQWINASDTNKALYHKIKNQSLESYKERFPKFDKASAWVNVSGQLFQKTPQRKIQTYLKWAASLFIPLLIGAGYFIYLNFNAPISPGSQHATLTLADGSKINLDLNKDLRKEEAGQGLISNIDNFISYKDLDRKENKETVFNTLETQRGQEYGVMLADGTKVFVNSMSAITYPVSFNSNERRVKLNGEAFFEVSHNPDMPFIVEVDDMEVKVLGTSFNIKAYQDENYKETVLVNGSVHVHTAEFTQTLVPDQKSTFYPLTKQYKIEEVDAVKSTSWIRGQFYFEEARLEDIFKDLSRWYDFETEFKSPHAKEILFEGWINRYESLEPILDIIAKTNKIKIKKYGKKLTVE
ncbi:FecR family protein [Belliella marina]|uniref:FecR family protein n=1 Tax=Belliella marina TaxID=1644146 RepID=A0ABW4VPG1_9BACT